MPINKKHINLIIKAAIFILAAVFIFNKLNDNDDLIKFNNLIKQLDLKKVTLILSAIFLLMLVNWGTEALKWQFLIKKIERITFWRAIESVFCGLTWAVFTPNRVGEYGGRVFFLSQRRRIQGVVVMMVGNIAQMVITNVLGALALLWFINRFANLNNWLLYAIVFLGCSFSLFFVVFYFNIRWLNQLLKAIKFLKKYQRFFGILGSYRLKELTKVLNFSLLRFCVFTTQYQLIIYLLIPGLSWQLSLPMILILFFVQSALPSLDLFDVGVRSMTATYFFSFVTNHEIAIMAAASLIWLVNLIIPAILGTFFIYKLNFFGNSS